MKHINFCFCFVLCTSIYKDNSLNINLFRENMFKIYVYVTIFNMKHVDILAVLCYKFVRICRESKLIQNKDINKKIISILYFY